MPLNLFYTMVQKSQKWPKTQIKGGSCLNRLRRFPGLQYLDTCKRRKRFDPIRVDAPKISGSLRSGYANIRISGYVLILKTLGNRKGDCAWSCSRWQTQPEEISKSQRTNQCHSLRTLYWFVLCNLQIISGCVCHLEQLHAQSPFLFPIVFSINLIPFFDICSVLAVLSPGLFGSVLLYLGRCAVATVAVCGFGRWFGVSLRAATSNLLSSPDHPSEIKQTCAPAYKTVDFSQSMLSSNKHVVQICRSSQSAAVQTVQVERRTSPFNGIERSLSRAVVIKTKFLLISATTFPTALSLYIAEDGRKHKHNHTLSAKKHVVQICRSSLSAAADGLADGSGERWTSPFNGDAQSGNGIERSLSRVVVPPSLPVSATTFPTAFSVYIAQGACERISATPASCSQRQNCFHSKRKKTLTWSILLAWSMPTKWYWVIHGRLTSERKAYTSYRHS